MMTSGMIVFLGIIVAVLLLSLLKVERVVRLAIWSYIVLGFAIALGVVLVNFAGVLNQAPEVVFLWLTYQQYAAFLINALPTLILVFSALFLWFLMQYGSLSVKLSDDMTERKLQTWLWAFLALWGLISFLYFSLFYFKGAVYEWIFLHPEVKMYVQHLPLFSLSISIFVIAFASRFPFKLSLKKEEAWF